MSEFEYIECPEGQEQGPAVENVAPYCVPADEAMPGESFPPPLPFDFLPRELAETGPVDPLTVLVFGGIVLIAGVATWLTGRK